MITIYRFAFLAVIPLIAIALQGNVAARALKDYSRQRREGKDPAFHRDVFYDFENVEVGGRDKRESKDYNRKIPDDSSVRRTVFLCFFQRNLSGKRKRGTLSRVGEFVYEEDTHFAFCFLLRPEQ